MKCNKFEQWLHELLAIGAFSALDISLNGLQVGDRNRDVRKIAFAVDACLETFKRAAQEQADFLFVHHGLFWGKPEPVTGAHYDRIAYLINHDIALFAAHLPLDAHPVLGNNREIARVLGLEEVEPFGYYKGTPLGVKGVLSGARTIKELEIALFGVSSEQVTRLPFGKKQNTRVGIISGSAANQVAEAISEELDIYITGEPSHQVYHTCLEQKINMLCAGHYATETYGVRAVQQVVEKELGLETVFIDFPTGL